MKNVLVAVFALHLIACSATAVDRAGDGGPDAAGGGGGGGTGATGGSGGGAGTCGPGDQDCICPGGHFTCTNNRLTCVCPQQCSTFTSCGQDSFCYFYDGNCGHQAAGYCLSLADASKRACGAKAVCGCDDTLDTRPAQTLIRAKRLRDVITVSKALCQHDCVLDGQRRTLS